LEALDTFLSLEVPAGENVFVAEAVHDGKYRIGRSVAGHAVVFFAFERCSGAPSSPRRLAALTYTPPAPIEIRTAAGRSATEQLARIECCSTDEWVIGHFLRVTRSLLDDVTLLDESQFDAALDAVVAIFRAIRRGARRTVQGVWSELAMIAWAGDAIYALAAWHSAPRALHDFAAGLDRLEVKSSATGIREHHVRLEQLSSISPGRTVVASMLLEETDNGASVDDLLSLVEHRIRQAPDAVRRMELIVAESLGRDWRESSDVRYDMEAARESVRLFDADSIPRVAEPLPPQIKDVRFVVDLSHVTEIASLELAEHSPFFACLLPRGLVAGTEG
jgi:hypothetical protein